MSESNKENEPGNTDVSKNIENRTKKVFSIDILRLTRNAQKQHGLRHGDYQRYRGLCFMNDGQFQFLISSINNFLLFAYEIVSIRACF